MKEIIKCESACEDPSIPVVSVGFTVSSTISVGLEVKNAQEGLMIEIPNFNV